MTLDRAARRYARRPSDFVGGCDEAMALSLDLACMAAGMAEVDDLVRHAKGAVQVVLPLGGA